MARHPKNNADYFTHDNGMRNDERIKAVRRKFSHLGYSIWNMLLERLCKSSGFRLLYDEQDIDIMAGDFEIEPEKLKEIIDYFIKLKLITQDKSVIFSSNLILRFDGLLKKRKRDAERLRKAADEKDLFSNNNGDKEKSMLVYDKKNIDNALVVLTDKKTVIADENKTAKIIIADENKTAKIIIADENTHSKVKESKVKESKVNTSIPSEEDFLSYCKGFLNGHYEQLEFSLKAKYEQWVEDNWVDGHKKEIKNWKTKIKNTVPHLKRMPLNTGNNEIDM